MVKPLEILGYFTAILLFGVGLAMTVGVPLGGASLLGERGTRILGLVCVLYALYRVVTLRVGRRVGRADSGGQDLQG